LLDINRENGSQMFYQIPRYCCMATTYGIICIWAII